MSVPNSVVLLSGCGATLHLFRFCLDLIVEAATHDEKNNKDFSSSSEKGQLEGSKNNEKINDEPPYGSMEANKQKSKSNNDGSMSVTSGNMTEITEATSLITPNNGDDVENPTDPNDKDDATEMSVSPLESSLPNVSLFIHCILLAFFLKENLSMHTHHLVNFTITVFFGIVVNLRDRERKRFYAVNRVLYVSSSLLLLTAGMITGNSTASFAASVYVALAMTESRICKYPKDTKRNENKPALSREAIFILLKPYFWPDATTNSAILNRLLVILTWLVCF